MSGKKGQPGRPITEDDPRKNFNRSYTIRGTQPAAPRSPCAICYADGVLTTTDAILWFACPNGHPAWMRTLEDANKHAAFCNTHHAQDSR